MKVTGSDTESFTADISCKLTGLGEQGVTGSLQLPVAEHIL